jgi:hypothetical protein
MTNKKLLERGGGDVATEFVDLPLVVVCYWYVVVCCVLRADKVAQAVAHLVERDTTGEFRY